MKTVCGFTALLCAAVALSACTTMGTGTGSVSPGNAPVQFSWDSTDGGSSGMMSATLAGGKRFSGTYLQLSRDAMSWGPFPDFGVEYSSRVMADLQAMDGQDMRCQFHLNDPVKGMAGGGQGKCELKGGRSVDAAFAPA
jgi:hypothetical protein